MKINEKNLCAFAVSHTPVDHEGWLEMRGEINNKAYQRRWFVLKGNLLFYFDKKGDREPFGVIILEGCTIELTEEESYSFKLVFHCDTGRTFYMCADCEASMEEWMKALAYASYDYMRLMVADLQRQLQEAESDPDLTATKLDDEPKVPPRGQRINPFNKTLESSGKTVHGSRPHKESRTPEATRRNKTSFRDLHAMFGRKVLADRNEWRMNKVKSQEKMSDEVPALIQL